MPADRKHPLDGLVKRTTFDGRRVMVPSDRKPLISDRITDLERRLAEAEADNKRAWEEFRALSVRGGESVTELQAQLIEAEAAHAADRALLRKALKALATCAIPLEVIGGSIVEDGIYTELSEELQQVIVDEAIPTMRAVISSPEAKRAMEEQV